MGTDTLVRHARRFDTTEFQRAIREIVSEEMRARPMTEERSAAGLQPEEVRAR